MTVIEAAELVAHAAILSDRRAAQGQFEALALIAGRLHGVRAKDDIALTGRITAAWALDWSDVPRSVVARPGNGAVAIRDEQGREFVLPIDDWWMSPPTPTQLATALDSSGLALLIRRYGAPTVLSDATRPTVIVPRIPSLFTRAEIVARVALIGGGSLIPISAIAAVIVALAGHGLPFELWCLPPIAASLAVLVAAVQVMAGRRHVRQEPSNAIRPHGPSWFTEAASFATDSGHQLLLTDGQGLWRRLETPSSTLSPMAVSRVVFAVGDHHAALLVDGTGTVRAELDAATWYPSGADELEKFCNALGIVTTHQADVRSSPGQRLDTHSNLDTAKESLSSFNQLGVPRVTPVLFGTFLPVSAGVMPFAAGVPWAGALCLTAAATNLVLTCWLGWHETSVRVGDPTKQAADLPKRMSARSATLATVPIVALLTMIWAIPAGSWGLVGAAVLVAVAFPALSWVAYRRRALISEHGALPMAAWWASGAPRGDEP